MEESGKKQMKSVGSILQKVFSAVVILLMVFSLSGFIAAPLTGDVKVFMAGANQANYLSPELFVGAFRSWELKSVFARVVSCFVYKTATLFVPYSSYAFEAVSKAVYAVLILLVSYLSMRWIFPNERRKIIQGVISCSTFFFAMHTCCQLQVEMTASLFILLAFSLYINAIKTETRTKAKLFSAGLLIGTTFFIKSVLILLSVTVVAAICIYKKENGLKLSIREMLIVVAGSFASLALTSLLIAIINPTEFRDILDAANFQGTILDTKLTFSELATIFYEKHKWAVRFLPVVALGVICIPLNAFSAVCEKKWSLFLFHFVMWLMPALFIFISDQYFIYHFAAYIFPALIEIYYAILHKKLWNKLIMGAFALFLLYWYATRFSILSSHTRDCITRQTKMFRDRDAFLESIDFDKNAPVLYLDDGMGAYTLGNRSQLRYFFPLPLQRIPDDSDLACRKECLEETLAYDGRYISVVESWFYNYGYNQNIREKIQSEYTLIGSYKMFTPPVYFDSSDDGEYTIKLYERKQG
ncbi:MAG: hypothetical protein J5379_09660 [Clostridiales bacterium]|nr:hypothetical protein [Clostridiales bacterium]